MLLIRWYFKLANTYKIERKSTWNCKTQRGMNGNGREVVVIYKKKVQMVGNDIKQQKYIMGNMEKGMVTWWA